MLLKNKTPEILEGVKSYYWRSPTIKERMPTPAKNARDSSAHESQCSDWRKSVQIDCLSRFPGKAKYAAFILKVPRLIWNINIAIFIIKFHNLEAELTKYFFEDFGGYKRKRSWHHRIRPKSEHWRSNGNERV